MGHIPAATIVPDATCGLTPSRWLLKTALARLIIPEYVARWKLDAREDSRANLKTLRLRTGLIGQDAEELSLSRGGRHIAGLEG